MVEFLFIHFMPWNIQLGCEDVGIGWFMPCPRLWPSVAKTYIMSRLWPSVAKTYIMFWDWVMNPCAQLCHAYSGFNRPDCVVIWSFVPSARLCRDLIILLSPRLCRDLIICSVTDYVVIWLFALSLQLCRDLIIRCIAKIHILIIRYFAAIMSTVDLIMRSIAACVDIWLFVLSRRLIDDRGVICLVFAVLQTSLV